MTTRKKDINKDMQIRKDYTILNEENDAKKSKYALSFQTIKRMNNILN